MANCGFVEVGGRQSREKVDLMRVLKFWPLEINTPILVADMTQSSCFNCTHIMKCVYTACLPDRRAAQDFNRIKAISSQKHLLIALVGQQLQRLNATNGSPNQAGSPNSKPKPRLTTDNSQHRSNRTVKQLSTHFTAYEFWETNTRAAIKAKIKTSVNAANGLNQLTYTLYNH